MWDLLIHAVEQVNVEHVLYAQEIYMDQHSTDQLRAHVLKAAQQYGVPAGWLLAIILQESSGNRFQIRYEPAFKDFYQVQSFAKVLGITVQTEFEAQKISWGLGQIMGSLAREQGHRGLMAELIDPDINLKHMCIRLSTLKKISPIPSDIFAMYNGGPGVMQKIKNGKYPNQNYVDLVNRNLKHLRF